MRAIKLALADLAEASLDDWVFFDRALIDAATALQHLTGEAASATVGQHRFHQRVFLVPPWPKIYVTDPKRQHEVYRSLGYEVTI